MKIAQLLLSLATLLMLAVAIHIQRSTFALQQQRFIADEARITAVERSCQATFYAAR